MHHIVAKSTYYRVIIWLGVLFVVTVAAARIDLGGWNVPVALTVPIVKATLIILFFMHVRYGSPLVRRFAAAGFLWLLILLSFIASDVLTRKPGVWSLSSPSSSAAPSTTRTTRTRTTTTTSERWTIL